MLEGRDAFPDYVLSVSSGLAAEGADCLTISTPRLERMSGELPAGPAPTVLPLFRLAYAGGWQNAAPYARGWLRAAGALARHRPQVLHVQWLVRPRLEATALPGLARAIGAAFVYTAHNVLPHEPTELDEQIYGSLYRRCDAVIVHTEAARRAIGERWPDVDPSAVHVVPMPVHVTPSASPARGSARALLRLPAEGPVVAFIGGIRPYKGLPDLVEAFSRLHLAERATLLIAGRPGDGEDLRQVEAMVNGRGDVRLMARYLSDEEIEAAFSAADVVALPYRAIDQSDLLVNAMAHGKAIVASALPGFTETLTDRESALFHPPGDVERIRVALARLVADAALRERLGAVARRRADARHSMRGVARRTLEVYAAVAARRAPRRAVAWIRAGRRPA